MVRWRFPMKEPHCKDSWFICELYAIAINLTFFPLCPLQCTNRAVCTYPPEEEKRNQSLVPTSPPTEVSSSGWSDQYLPQLTNERALALSPLTECGPRGSFHSEGLGNWSLMAVVTASGLQRMSPLAPSQFSFLSTFFSSATSSSVKTQKQSFWVNLVTVAKWK